MWYLIPCKKSAREGDACDRGALCEKKALRKVHVTGARDAHVPGWLHPGSPGHLSFALDAFFK